MKSGKFELVGWWLVQGVGGWYLVVGGWWWVVGVSSIVGRWSSEQRSFVVDDRRSSVVGGWWLVVGEVVCTSAW